MTYLPLLALLGCAPLEATMPTLDPGPGALPLPDRFTDQLAASAPDGPPRTRHLHPDGTAQFTNRLALETSPYLRQHAHNPVNWFPWGDEAFALAAELGRPVLLSVGYSTCHWCHVMEEESFEDLEIARYVNEHYVAIKVDREERPDVDAVYMTALQAIGGHGGWPMNMWLTPDRRPFFGGTYFPPRDGDRGARTGFLTILQRAAEAYAERPDDVAKDANQITAILQKGLAPESRGSLPGAEVLAAQAVRYAKLYDPQWGGVGSAPKFPSSLPIRFLLREHRRTGDAGLLEMATATLHKMADGGMHDQLGGGFHRYSTDRQWLVPHFEEMLYDNALLTVAYVEAWQQTGDPRFADVARGVLRYIARDMTSPDGAFYAATDADSPVPGTDEREEGWSFTWTPEELSAALDAEHAAAVAAYYGVLPGGNFEGRSVLHVSRPLADVARELGTTPAALERSLAAARQTLRAVRDARPQPLRDDKIVAAWNGLMISAFARASLALQEPAYAATAARAADFLLTEMVVDGRLRRTHHRGEARHAAVLEDHAFLAAGLLDLFEATGEIRWLDAALAQDAVIRDHFELADGGWYRTADDAEALLARERPTHDGAEPSGSSVHALNLLRLAALTADDAYRARADAALEAQATTVARGALSELLLAVDWRAGRAREIVIVTPRDRGDAAELLGVLAKNDPWRRVLVVVDEAKVAALAERVPPVDGKLCLDGRATAYVCEGGACELPTTDPAVFARLLAD